MKGYEIGDTVYMIGNMVNHSYHETVVPITIMMIEDSGNFFMATASQKSQPLMKGEYTTTTIHTLVEFTKNQIDVSVFADEEVAKLAAIVKDKTQEDMN